MEGKEGERDRHIDKFGSIYIYLSRAGVKLLKPTFMPETCQFFFSIPSSWFFCAAFVRKVLRLILPVSVRPTARIVRFAACNWQPLSIHRHVSYMTKYFIAGSVPVDGVDIHQGING